LTKPYLQFEASNSLVGGGKLVLDGIRCQCITEYESANGKSVLRVSEITELVVFPIDVPEKDVTIFEAKTNDVYRPGREGVDFWHEVSISSVEANKVIQQNRNLELGDEAAWTPEHLSKMNAAEAMYLPACEMLKQMDGIGFYNDNGVDRNARPPKQSPALEVEQKPRFQWW
jgi:hypothetical protein